jgi:hypothetical protein
MKRVGVWGCVWRGGVVVVGGCGGAGRTPTRHPNIYTHSLVISPAEMSPSGKNT